MKTLNFKLSILILLTNLFLNQVYSQNNVAILVNNKQTLTSRENAVKILLTDNGYTVVLKNYNEANFDNLKDFKFTVSTDNGSISSDLIYLLLFGGCKVVLLYDAAKPLGGDWNSIIGDWYLYVENREAYLQDYVKGAKFIVQQSQAASCITANYPSGWKVIGRRNSEYSKTALYRTHASGGKGVILTYDPLYYTEGFGKDLFKRIIGYIIDTQVVQQVVVPDGNVAFLIAGFDDQKPDLTERENSVKIKLWELGYTNKITYISNSRVWKSDISKARFVIITENSVIDDDLVYSQITQQGGKVILLYNAAEPLGGDWNSIIGDWYLYVENREAYLQDYVKGAKFIVQQSQAASCITANYPSGWTVIGRRNSEYSKTALYRTHASGGKGVILTYDPLYYTEGFGKDLFKRIIGYIIDTQVVQQVVVPDGNVAFLIAGFDDQKPDLTERENSVKIKLWELGYTNKITYISNSRVWKSDISKARFVIITENSVIDDDLVYSQIIQQGGKVILLYNAAEPLGGDWNSIIGDWYLYVENREAYLQDYVKGAKFIVQQSQAASCITANYPSGWTVIGRRNSEYSKTALYRTHASGGKGVIFTYNVTYLTMAGDTVFQKIISWTSPTGVGESEPQNTIPIFYSLAQNFPNPFNPSTSISFDLPKQSQVALLIYDLSGRVIARLINNEVMPAGSHTRQWDASNLSGGIYIYRLQTNAYSMTKKLTLLK